MVRLRDRHPELFARITDAPDLIAMRNHLSHRYDKADLDVLADTVNDDLPVLKSEAEFLYLELD